MHPLSLVLWIITATFIMAGAIIAVIAAHRAPEGFEDATGFHHVRGSEVRNEDVASDVAPSGASLV